MLAGTHTYTLVKKNKKQLEFRIRIKDISSGRTKYLEELKLRGVGGG